MGQGNTCMACYAIQPCQTGILRSISGDECDDLEHAVLLNIYDLDEDWLHTNDIFSDVLEFGGAFHAGVEIFGREWSFGTDGVLASRPKEHDIHVYRQTVVMGYTKYDPEEVLAILEDEVHPKWPGRSYSLLSKNCCSFARSFCKRLTGNIIPDWVDRLPRLLNQVTKPVKGVADAAAGVGKVMNSAPQSRRMLASGRECSIESESDFSVASFMTTPTPTPRYDPRQSELSFGIRSSFESEPIRVM